MKIKVALLNPFPVYAQDSAAIIQKKLAILLNGDVKNNLDVKVFSFGNENKKIKSRYYKELIIKNNGFIGNKNKAIKIADYISLFFLRYSLMYYLRNNDKRMLEEIERFNPDLFIAPHELIDIPSNYKKYVNKDIPIISALDDYRQISEALSNIKKKIKEKRNILIKLIYKIGINTAGNAYTLFLTKKYEQTLKISNKITFYTDESKELTVKRYPDFAKKFLVIPPLQINYKWKKQKTRKIVKNVLFIGVCKYQPNEEAISLIKEIIAPKLKNINFLLLGKDCVRYKHNNIISLGFVKDIRKSVSKADICIAPILHGGGIKTKVLLYLSAGKPVIATAKAFEGFPIKNGINGIIEDDITKYPEIINKLSKDFVLRSKLSNGAQATLLQFSDFKIKKKWVKLIKQTAKA